MRIRRRRRRWPGDGVFAFPADPRRAALEAPAFWDAALCPYVVMLDAATSGFPGEPPSGFGLERHLAERTVAHQVGTDGLLYILKRGGVLQRIWLRCDPAGTSFAAVIPLDAMAEIRIGAAHHLARWLRGVSSSPSAACPTFYQAQRLDLLLSILDLRDGVRVTSHEVARRLVYPRMTIGRGAAWKASPERRRTQRLIREAEALAAGGYRALLAGRAGRQK